MATLSALSMSQTKEDLIKHLGLPQATYALMAKETDQVYKWLTRDLAHLKSNCKRDPPYDWSDILETKKDYAMQLIANGGDMYTKYYWNLALPTSDCPNWVAKWFLYHKFRYRDGRNRSSVKRRSHQSHKRRQSSQYDRYSEPTGSEYAYSNPSSPSNAESSTQTSSDYYHYDTSLADSFSTHGYENANERRSKAYDPVRDL